MQIEQEKNEMQLQKTMHLKNQLGQIEISQRLDRVRSGSLVIANNEKYFIAIGIGKIKLEEQQYFVISPESPVGQLFLGKQKNEVVEFRGKRMTIHDIL